MKLFTLISIGSEKYRDDGIAKVEEWALSQRAAITFFLLDEPERYNLQVFDRISCQDSLQIAVERGRRWLDRLGPRRCLTWSAANSRFPRLRFNKAMLQQLARANRSLMNALLSETFSNLRPRFRRIGVDKKSEPAVHVASQYLCDEMALKLTLAQDVGFDGEAALYPQLRTFNWLLQNYRSETNETIEESVHFHILSPCEAERSNYPIP